MEQAARALRDDEPLMVAWPEWKKSEAFQNCLKWNGEHAVGSLWQAFMDGWKAAGGIVE